MIIFKRHNQEMARSAVIRGEQVLVIGKPTLEEKRRAGPPFCHARQWGQLIDRDLARLEETARALLSGPVKISGTYAAKQGFGEPFVLLCGDPLRRLIRNANP